MLLPFARQKVKQLTRRKTEERKFFPVPGIEF
jgi:hypothetical protein